MSGGMKHRAVGIDLAGVETRPTGFCVLDVNLNAITCVLYTDDEIFRHALKAEPDVVSIDAPLALPKGRCCLRDECGCRNRGHLRECDRELLRMGIRFFPVTLGPMRKLTLRGISLRKALEREGLRTIETYPGAVQDILGIPRKQRGLEKLRRALIRYGIRGDVEKRDLTDHELDAITSALMGKLYLEGEYRAIGDPTEISMILPVEPSGPESTLRPIE